MKIHGLTSHLAAATLFLALTGGLRAENTMTPAPAENRPAAMAGAARGKRAAEMLQRYDKNGDGRIDDDERIDAREAMRAARSERQMADGSRPLRARMLEQFDKNKDGLLDDEERAAAQKAIRERGLGMKAEQARPMARTPGGRLRAEALKRFDANGDGQLDESERAEMRKARGDRLAENPQIIQRFDKNGDGKLDESERAAARAAMQQRMQAGAPGKAGKTNRRGK